MLWQLWGPEVFFHILLSKSSINSAFPCHYVTLGHPTHVSISLCMILHGMQCIINNLLSQNQLPSFAATFTSGFASVFFPRHRKQPESGPDFISVCLKNSCIVLLLWECSREQENILAKTKALCTWQYFVYACNNKQEVEHKDSGFIWPFCDSYPSLRTNVLPFLCFLLLFCTYVLKLLVIFHCLQALGRWIVKKCSNLFLFGPVDPY